MKTIKKVAVLLVLLLLYNCNNSEVEKLELRLSKLEKENSKLIDSLAKLEYSKIISSEMILIPNNKSKGKSVFGMVINRLKGKKVNLYQTDTLHFIEGVKKKLIYSNYSSSQFEIEIDPDYIKNNVLYLVGEYDIDSVKVQIPGVLMLNPQ